MPWHCFSNTESSGVSRIIEIPGHPCTKLCSIIAIYIDFCAFLVFNSTKSHLCLVIEKFYQQTKFTRACALVGSGVATPLTESSVSIFLSWIITPCSSNNQSIRIKPVAGGFYSKWCVTVTATLNEMDVTQSPSPILEIKTLFIRGKVNPYRE